MAEVSNFNFNTRKRKGFLPIDWKMLLQTDDSVDITSAEKSKGRIGVVQQPETELQMKTDDELEETITRLQKNFLTVGHKLPDKGEKLKALLRRCVAEVERRKRSRVHKDDERGKENVKRMRRLRDENKQTNQVKGKLIDAETKIVVDLQKKLCDSSVQVLDVAEKKWASAVIDDDSKWLNQEGLPLLVKKLVDELSKENVMTVSELRILYQRSSSS